MIDLAENNAALWEVVADDKIDGYSLQTYYELESKVESSMIELQQHICTEATATTPRPTIQPTNSVQLPRITLPKFNGDYLQWVTFKDLFNEIIHQSSSLNDAQRMHYLSQSLVEEPKNLIKHLPSTGANYSAAWNILTSRYDNKRLMVATLLNKLLSQPTAKTDSPSSLKALHDVTKECLHGLRTQGIPIQHWDAIITHLVFKKMDQASQTIFEQNIDDCRRLVTQDEVLKFLERRFQALEL